MTEPIMVPLFEVLNILRNIETLEKVPGAKIGLPEYNILWDAAIYLQDYYQGTIKE